MKRIIIYIGAAALAGLGVVMATGNPSQSVYEEYVVQQLTEYLKMTSAPKHLKFWEFITT